MYLDNLFLVGTFFWRKGEKSFVDSAENIVFKDYIVIVAVWVLNVLKVLDLYDQMLWKGTVELCDEMLWKTRPVWFSAQEV